MPRDCSGCDAMDGLDKVSPHRNLVFARRPFATDPTCPCSFPERRAAVKLARARQRKSDNVNGQAALGQSMGRWISVTERPVLENASRRSHIHSESRTAALPLPAEMICMSTPIDRLLPDIFAATAVRRGKSRLVQASRPGMRRPAARSTRPVVTERLLPPTQAMGRPRAGGGDRRGPPVSSRPMLMMAGVSALFVGGFAAMIWVAS
jgi:hypothetical protein